MEISEKGIKTNRPDGSPKGGRIRPSIFVAEVSNGSGHSNVEEDMEDEMCDVMRQLFVEGNVLDKIRYPTPRSSGSIHPNLPLVLYDNPSKFFAKLLKAI